MPGHPVGGEDESLLSGSAFCSHPHHPPAHVHDRQTLLCHGDEMCKYLFIIYAHDLVYEHELGEISMWCVCACVLTGFHCVAAGCR